ncbi:hypothetical protein [Rathayibacter rathayi]|uniref:Uncharacterized protein n=1 Tax=Rathayibacter rathayi TaxID=33887 RepID=A0ABX5A8V0_RATRA|nr:hypothetical protein [Rathayibacter rathayi]MWV75902.1 hypothetical protein [Rathayibacter rathayi NCPPB 2980 = VKM Ac-1601]PPF23014.1 hypothetical protein C5C34_10185 [Rathayibacter rathayi]PPF44734.1 hypothetical protein C5C08_12920 [Rathayibacter rathayi]PPF77375.1 hypothetical protein C5C14_12600 [Rathayibacter rathayi]PPG11465.1 hypothetical protein C5C11_12500 [Rathayibacter rathayi]
MMNSFGLRAMRYVETWRPAEFASIQDPAAHFAVLGAEISVRVAELARAMESEASLSSKYLVRVGELAMIQAQAREIAMGDLVYAGESELSTETTFGQWREDQPTLESMIEWADAMDPENPPAGAELQSMAETLMVPVDFLFGLTMAELPSRFLREHRVIWDSAERNRFEMSVAQSELSSL